MTRLHVHCAHFVTLKFIIDKDTMYETVTVREDNIQNSNALVN
jgi:hypothetical protein